MLVLSREAGSVLNLVKSDHIGVAIDSFPGSTLNVNKRDGEAPSPMGEYDRDPTATNELFPSYFVLVSARGWLAIYLRICYYFG